MKAAKPGASFAGAVARALCACAFLARSTGALAAPESASDCDAAGAVPVVIAAVDENFDLLLGDGRVVTLPGVDFAAAPVEPHAVFAWFEDRDAEVRALLAAPDRWGRTRVRAYLRPRGDAGAPPADAAAEALRRGWGRYRPDADAQACRPALLAAESEARDKRIGLWADPASILHGDDRQALAAAPPTMLVVEGVVQSVGAARGRIYLNLGKQRTSDLAIVILERNISAFSARGVESRKLAGHRIRVRGLLDRRFGPQIEITSPDALEIIGAAGGDSRSGEARGHTD